MAALEDRSTWAREDRNLCLDHVLGLLNQHLRKDVTQTSGSSFSESKHMSRTNFYLAAAQAFFFWLQSFGSFSPWLP